MTNIFIIFIIHQSRPEPPGSISNKLQQSSETSLLSTSLILRAALLGAGLVVQLSPGEGGTAAGGVVRLRRLVQQEATVDRRLRDVPDEFTVEGGG